jgi:hypothetical protein
MTKLRIVALTYKTFPATLPAVYQATVDVLKRMGMRVILRGPGQEDQSVGILASGERRQFDVDLDAMGFQGTRVRVLAREGAFFGENAATDLIARVANLLEQHHGEFVHHHDTIDKASVAILSAREEVVALAV